MNVEHTKNLMLPTVIALVMMCTIIISGENTNNKKINKSNTEYAVCI